MTFYRRILTIILFLAALGTALSGYLTYWKYFGSGCTQGPLAWLVSCGSGPKAVLIFGQPTCVYGFGMFVLVLIFGLIAFKRPPSGPLIGALITFGLIGTLFSGGLTVYEIFVLEMTFTTLPACVYGLIFFFGILITSTILRDKVINSVENSPTVESLL